MIPSKKVLVVLILGSLLLTAVGAARSEQSPSGSVDAPVQMPLSGSPDSDLEGSQAGIGAGLDSTQEGGLQLNPISRSGISEWVSLVASIAALLTAGAALLTLQEVKRQRAQAHKPHMVVPRVMVSGSVKGTGECDMRLEFPEQSGANQPEGATDCMLRVHNIAQGAAVNVEARWVCDYAGLIRSILSDQPEGKPWVAVDEDSDPSDGLITLTIRGSTLIVNLRSLQTQEFDFILPDSVDPSGTCLQLPPAFRMFLPLMYAAAMTGPTDDRRIPGITSLGLTLSYGSVAGESYTQRIRVEFNVMTISVGGMDDFQFTASLVAAPETH